MWVTMTTSELKPSNRQQTCHLWQVWEHRQWECTFSQEAQGKDGHQMTRSREELPSATRDEEQATNKQLSLLRSHFLHRFGRKIIRIDNTISDNLKPSGGKRMVFLPFFLWSIGIRFYLIVFETLKYVKYSPQNVCRLLSWLQPCNLYVRIAQTNFKLVFLLKNNRYINCSWTSRPPFSALISLKLNTTFQMKSHRHAQNRKISHLQLGRTTAKKALLCLPTPSMQHLDSDHSLWVCTE